MGGGEIQLLESRRHIEKLGHTVELFDMWAPQMSVDLLHQFSINPGVEQVMQGYCDADIPVALSTILWTIPDDPGFRQYLLNIFDKADILLTNSDMESELLSETLGVPSGKFFKTRNGISSDYLNTDSDKDFMSEYDITEPFVLSVANIDTRKNTALLVEACQRLRLELVLVGHIRDRDYYDSFAGQYAACRYLGAIDDAAMLKSAYQQCQLFALPSICETPGIAAMEAASQGANVVITSGGSTREYFDDRVTYVDPFDEDDVVAGIEHAVASAADEGLQEHVLSRYTWDKAALDIQAAYRSL